MSTFELPMLSIFQMCYNYFYFFMLVAFFVNIPYAGLTQKDNDGHRGDPNDPRVRLKRDCVGIMAAFKLKDPSQHVVIVANTHLYW